VNPDPEPDPGFENQKMKKIQPKLFLYQKLQFTYPQASIKDVQATAETFSPQKRTSSASKDEIFKPSSGSISGFTIRIRIQGPH
jgi:hypothetical protein